MNNRKNLSMLVALFLVMMTASSVVSGDGTDPLDPSDGGADWDGDGLTNAEEQSAGTDMTKADSDGDGLPDGWEVRNGLNPNNGGDANTDVAVSETSRGSKRLKHQSAGVSVAPRVRVASGRINCKRRNEGTKHEHSLTE